MEMNDLAVQLLSALRFAADKHRTQRRKSAADTPYINHPIEVAETLAVVGGVRDGVLLQAAILHDTVEDTDTTLDELERHFGAAVRKLVGEVTDDKSKPKQVRKQLQIEHAPALSLQAKQLKLADKICNVRDLGHSPPMDWGQTRCLEYMDWAEKVVAGCRGANVQLEALFDASVAESRRLLASESKK
jgi:guanosine-3',5'-bis(diphosphate) 3'-pyrophosphohydrolase